MRKIRLEFEKLEVESFVTNTSTSVRGTVNGNAEAYSDAEHGCDTTDTGDGGTDMVDCDPTVHYSCYNTCALYDTCAQGSACTLCPGGITWFCD